MELICSMALFTPLKRLAGLVIVGIMAGAVTTHVVLEEEFTFPCCLGAAGLLVFFLGAGPTPPRRPQAPKLVKRS
jgi:hypothetical protein